MACSAVARGLGNLPHFECTSQSCSTRLLPRFLRQLLDELNGVRASNEDPWPYAEHSRRKSPQFASTEADTPRRHPIDCSRRRYAISIIAMFPIVVTEFCAFAFFHNTRISLTVRAYIVYEDEWRGKSPGSPNTVHSHNVRPVPSVVISRERLSAMDKQDSQP